MTQSTNQAAANLQAAYDEQYTDDMTEWRELGGKHKARNILKVCENHQFSKVLDCGAGEGSILKFLSDTGAFPRIARDRDIRHRDRQNSRKRTT